MARSVGVVGLLSILSVIHTWPLAEAPARRLQEGADVLPGTWALTELARQMLRDPGHLMDGNMFFPFSRSLALLDHQLANALLAAPMIAAGATGAQTYNLVVLTTFVLSGVFTYLLVRRLTGSTVAGVVAGSAFAFGSYRAGHLLQAHLLGTQWVPLAMLAVHRYVERPSTVRWLGLTVSSLLVALSSWHVGIIGGLGIGIVGVLSLAGGPGIGWRRVTGFLLAATVCGLVLIPLARVYVEVGNQYPPRTGDGRETVESLTDMSVDLGGLLAVPDNSRTPYSVWLSPTGLGHPGVFPGVVVLALVVVALPALWRGTPRAGSSSRSARLLHGAAWASAGMAGAIGLAAAAGSTGAPVVDLLRPLAPFALLGAAMGLVFISVARRTGTVAPDAAAVATYAALAAAGALLALGPRVTVGGVDVGSGLWRLDLLPVRLIIRAPERFSLLMTLGMSVLAGFGVARLLGWLRTRQKMLVAATVVLAVNVDLAFAMSAFRDVPGPTPADQWLATSAEEGAVVDYPLHWTNMWAIYASQAYGRRVVNGAGYLSPSAYHELEAVPDLSDAQLDLLWEYFHPRFVVVRTSIYEPDDRARILEAIQARPQALVPRAAFDSELVYELVDRGHAPQLYRRWPLTALGGRSEVSMAGAVTPGRVDRITQMVVALNGRTLLDVRGAEAEETREYRMPFGRDELRQGINIFEIRADYRFAEEAERILIGATGVELPADVMIDSNRISTLVQVNGRQIPAVRGYLLIVLDPDNGEVTDIGQFDVSWSAEQAEALVAFVDGVPDGAPVLVATEFDASRELTETAVQALGRLGIETDLRGQFQVMHAAIGAKGATPGSALETTDRISARIEAGEPARRQVQLERFDVD